MYKSERVIIDTRRYDIDEIFERYKRGKLIFYHKNNSSKVYKNKVIQEVLEALSRGIPFPPVCVSELQTGEMLVLDKSDRLRFLMEYLDHGFYYPKDIFYYSVILYVIDYMNPRYMHMQTGAFIEEWSATQEQGVRNVLYQREMEYIFEHLLNGMYPLKSELSTQYRFVYFIMVNFLVLENSGWRKEQDADKFQLLEDVLYESEHMNAGFMRDLYAEYEDLYYTIKRDDYRISPLSRTSLEIQTKYLCFISVGRRFGKFGINHILENRKIRQMIKNCDMSYSGIREIVECFERGIYD